MPGSQRVQAAVVGRSTTRPPPADGSSDPVNVCDVLLHKGDILGLSINNMDSLVQMPLGCGEQNMIRFAPSIYILQYLDKSTLDNQEIRSRSLTFLTEGKQ